MKSTTLAACATVCVAAACQSSVQFVPEHAQHVTKLEIQYDEAGALAEVEYHVAPEAVPPAVRAAMDALHPGGPYTDAEHEFVDGEPYWELNRLVDGLEVEAMFSPEGVLFSEEVEVRPAQVPAAVRDAVRALYPAGTVSKYEEIRDSERVLEEYHVKLTEDGRNHKLLLSTGGALLGDFLELVSEIEVPVVD